MSQIATNRRPRRKYAIQTTTCPACRIISQRFTDRCPNCQFTGADTLNTFPGNPPPLLPILDAGAIWKPEDLAMIESARTKISARFPQFKWRICSVCLPQELNLAMFAFWMLNACPLADDETENDRHWTVLLLINATTGAVAAAPGYAAETWLNTEQWQHALAAMDPPWTQGRHGEAVVAFFKNTQRLLEASWRRMAAPTPAATRP